MWITQQFTPRFRGSFTRFRHLIQTPTHKTQPTLMRRSSRVVCGLVRGLYPPQKSWTCSLKRTSAPAARLRTARTAFPGYSRWKPVTGRGGSGDEVGADDDAFSLPPPRCGGGGGRAPIERMFGHPVNACGHGGDMIQRPTGGLMDSSALGAVEF